MKVPFTEVYRRGVGEHEQASAAARRPRAHMTKRFLPETFLSALGEF